MRRKEVSLAVIGGIVGAVLTMAVCSFSLVGAQDKAGDAAFHKVTCRELEVVDEDGVIGVFVVVHPELGGTIRTISKDGKVAMGNSMKGVPGVAVIGKNGKGGVLMGIHEEAGFVKITKGEDNESQVLMRVTEHGGAVGVFGESEGHAVMSINQYSHGAVHTWDKNGKISGSLGVISSASFR